MKLNEIILYSIRIKKVWTR